MKLLHFWGAFFLQNLMKAVPSRDGWKERNDGVGRPCMQALRAFDSQLKQPLPKAPLPSLKDTVRKYLEYARVITPCPDTLKRTEDLAEEFLHSDGLNCQALLQEIAEHETNWVNRFWLPDMYLNNRVALPINSNPGYIFPMQKFENTSDFLNYASCMVRGVLSYKDLIDGKSVKQDMSTGRQKAPLCMDQYWRIFSSHRFAFAPVDELSTNADKDNGNNEHIIVMRKNQAFIVFTKWGGERLCHSEVKHQLEEVLRIAENRPDTSVIPVGVLTSGDRDKAAQAFDILNRDFVNRKSLLWVTSSAFVLCLDSEKSTRFEINACDSTEQFLAKQGHHILHGGGLKNGKNRWFDRTLQFIISENGLNGLNIEHSVAEGIVIISLAEHALNFVQENLVKFSRWKEPPKRILKPKPLLWHISEDLRGLMHDMEADYQRLSNDLDLEILIYDGYGKDYPKSKQCSPDAFIQLALQLAHFKTHGYLVSTYESASTRRFKHGRVDNIRAATPEAFHWATTMETQGESKENKLKAWSLAVKKQTQVMTENVSGHGIDNHLVALRELSREKNNTIPVQFFTDSTLDEVFRFPLSTSQVGTSIKGSFVNYVRFWKHHLSEFSSIKEGARADWLREGFASLLPISVSGKVALAGWTNVVGGIFSVVSTVAQN